MKVFLSFSVPKTVGKRWTSGPNSQHNETTKDGEGKSLAKSISVSYSTPFSLSPRGRSGSLEQRKISFIN